MEPKIYKPGAYKSPGIYNGAGGIYKGRGVYNAFNGGLDVIYETDFSNFDFENKIDYPKIGNPKNYSFTPSYYEKTTINVDGIDYTGIRHKVSSSSSFYADFSVELLGVDLYTMEATVYKPSLSGTGGAIEYWGGDDFCGSPIINCLANRGYGVTRRPAYNIDQYFNNFSFWYEAYYYSSESSIRDITGICKGGVTFDAVNNIGKVYLKNKKALITNNVRGTSLGFYADGNMELYLLGFRIVKKDLFEEME